MKVQHEIEYKKCVYVVDSGIFLVFIISHRAIEVDTKKIDDIVNMPTHTKISQLRTSQGTI